MNFKQHRVSNNLTQEQVAQDVGVQRTTVAMWESGKSRPRAELLPKLASLTTQPAASNNEQNDNTAAQIRAAAAARARYEAIKDEQAEERLTGIAQGTEMAPKNSQNPLLNWSPKSFPGLTIQ